MCPQERRWKMCLHQQVQWRGGFWTVGTAPSCWSGTEGLALGSAVKRKPLSQGCWRKAEAPRSMKELGLVAPCCFTVLGQLSGWGRSCLDVCGVGTDAAVPHNPTVVALLGWSHPVPQNLSFWKWFWMPVNRLWVYVLAEPAEASWSC